MKELVQPDIKGVHPYLFDVYMKANATLPQASDGIKWMVHDAFFSNPVVPFSVFVQSPFSAEQLQVLRTKTNAIHHANNIPFHAPTPDLPLPDGNTPISDHDYQVLLIRVRHSLVNNLLADQHFWETGTALPGYKNDLDHDLETPTQDMIQKAAAYTEGLESYPFREMLLVIGRTVLSDEGKQLLKRYREEFSKNHKRTSSVWRQEGYREAFANLVRIKLAQVGIDSSDSHISYLLQLHNL